MSAYVKATNFATKDTLPTGDANKIVKGTEIDNEFNAIAGAISSKSDLASPTFTGSPAAPTATAGSNTTQIANTSYVRGELTTLIPAGIITLWSGAISAIPAGWVLCNGANSTPDLRDRFVVGAGTTYAVGATGGANTVTLDSTMIPAHTHSFSATTGTESAGHTHTYSGSTGGQSANHSHSGTTGGMNANNPHSHGIGGREYGGGGNPGGDLNGPNQDFGYRTYNTDINHGHDFTTGGVSSDHSHAYSGTTSSVSANHTHTVSGTSGSTGGGLAHENRPPYYALAWIMKT